jgi:hypothetical protein
MVRKQVPPSSAAPPLPPHVPADASHVIPGMKRRRPNWALRLEHSTLAHLNSLGRTIDNPTELGFVRWPNPNTNPKLKPNPDPYPKPSPNPSPSPSHRDWVRA